jgi:hypothetical protein
MAVPENGDSRQIVIVDSSVHAVDDPRLDNQITWTSASTD